MKELQCQNCGQKFVVKSPKNTRAKFCTRRCCLADFRKRHRAKLRDYSLKWAAENRLRSREIKTRWNRSESGTVNRLEWRKRNWPEIKARYLEGYHADPDTLKGRQRSRKILQQHDSEMLCRICGSSSLVECHHRDLNPRNSCLENLEWLCSECHKWIHTEIRKLLTLESSPIST